MADATMGVLDRAVIQAAQPETEKKKRKKKRKKEKAAAAAVAAAAEAEAAKDESSSSSSSSKKKKKKKKKKARVEIDMEEEEAGASASAAPPAYPNGRRHTVTVALPGSVISNAQTVELQTYLAGQLARALTVFEVDEIVVFDDHGWGDEAAAARGAPPPKRARGRDRSFNPNVFLAHVLQYLETPQYLRRALFPMHDDLKLAGLLNPLDAPHHMRASERTRFREGVVTEEVEGGCRVNVGLRRDIEIAQAIPRNSRITVEVEPALYDSMHQRTPPGAQRAQAKAVAPSAPREQDGTYWGYTTRLAPTLSAVWSECPYPGGYSLSVGTSERNSESVLDPSFALPKFEHLLIVIGGVEGLEYAVNLDPALEISGENAYALFDKYINIAPTQGSRTIRTEEALLVTMSCLQTLIAKNKELV